MALTAALVHAGLLLAMSSLAAGRELPDAPDPEKLSREAADASRAGDYRAAEARYRVLALAYPALPSATIGLGRSLARLGRVAEAVEWLGKAADLGAGADAAALGGVLRRGGGSPRGSRAVLAVSRQRDARRA